MNESEEISQEAMKVIEDVFTNHDLSLTRRDAEWLKTQLAQIAQRLIEIESTAP